MKQNKVIQSDGHKFNFDLKCEGRDCKQTWEKQQNKPTKCKSLTYDYEKKVKR